MIRKRSFFCLALLMALLFAFSLTAPEAGLKERVSEKILPNGLKIILLENHKAPLVTFQVWYRVGSRNESWGKTGLSHMLEHMMFKGTKKLSPEEFSRIIQENGGNDNAFTSSDFTAYFTNISSDRARVPIDLEADRMQNLVLREEDFTTERMVVTEERRLRTDDEPTSYLEEQVTATAFQVSPYHWPVIGWMEDIQRFTLEDVKAYHKLYYNPANTFLVVVGDFRKDEMYRTLLDAFGKIPKGQLPVEEKDKDPVQTGERRVTAKRVAELPFIYIGYHVPNLSNPDGYVLEVIAEVLSGGKSSRLYKILVHDRQLALAADADNSLLSRDPNLFTLSVQALPGKDPAEIEKVLDREIERLKAEPVSEQELNKAKNRLEADFVYGQDSIFYQGMLLAEYENSSNWKAIDDYIPNIRKVSPGDIMRIAKNYLSPDKRTVGVLIPLPPKDGESRPSGFMPPKRMIR